MVQNLSNLIDLRKIWIAPHSNEKLLGDDEIRPGALLLSTHV